MKKHNRHKVTALFCFISLLVTVGTTGCSKTQNESTSDMPSETVSISEKSERSDKPSETSAKNNTSSTISETDSTSEKSETSEKSQTSEKSETSETSETSEKSQTSDKQDQPSETSAKESSSGTVSAPTSTSEPSENSAEESGSHFTYSENNGNIILTRYNGNETAPEIPSTLNGKPVTAIGESCFAGNTSVKKIVMPDGITDIGDYAFECCSHLENVAFPDSLKTIGEGAFSACTMLSAVQLPENTEVIKKGAFLYCQSLKDLELPEGIQELGNFAFSNCSRLTAVTFKGDRIKNLPDRLFYKCNKLTEININHTLDSIGKRTFANCSSLTSISLPGELQSVGDYAFEGGSSLTEVSINAVSVSATAYAGCYQLPEDMQPKPEEETDTDEPQQPTSGEMSKPETLGSIAGDSSLFDEEKFSSYRIISNDEFSAWSQKYISFCSENGIPIEREDLFYTMLYKGEVIPHYMGMTSAENHDPAMSKDAANAFGDDYAETYLMMDHGLYTELKRGRMCDDLVLYSGVYNSQLMAAAGTSEVPTLEQLKNCIGNIFTDPIMISTTTDIGVACNFSDTLFIIYTSKESAGQLGAMSLDSIVGTNEKEILMSKNASYRILDVGTMAVKTTDHNDNETEIYRNYIKVELL